ncbi:class I SAM-dependent methyltransferase [Streptomyces kunmingensis]|uniref:Class I SAM-dependent methyltransferase n=1 Tax=Streptomyces kunmingensis TaxID=68225 RepID=A0ABU6C2W2_9ACTN|nr:class I SAM-dependent methyltransferase [Streptomyces kunmingensis]MEB3958873.1 class I SAM-dependent methyltransferase [Streptomyces kunmingensis]
MPDSYADLSHFYDLVMTSGYYDYDAYARNLLTRIGPRRDVLELGIGTGLVGDRLLALGPQDLRLTGIDHTDNMLAQARDRLGDRARLAREDVLDMSSPSAFDVAYSIGGVWYIVQNGEESWLSSHLMDEEDNAAGLANLAAAIRPGGSLLLSVQGPHRRYDRTLPGGLVYTQHVAVDPEGRHTKDYFIEDQGVVLAHQRLRFRLFPQETADRLLERCGFHFQESDGVLWQYDRC